MLIVVNYWFFLVNKTRGPRLISCALKNDFFVKKRLLVLSALGVSLRKNKIRRNLIVQNLRQKGCQLVKFLTTWQKKC